MVDRKKQNLKINDLDFPVVNVVFIVGSFLLAILDMIFLKDAFESVRVLGLDPGLAMVTAFIIATVANLTALLWGHENAVRSEKRTINRHSVGLFIAWIAIGLFYATVRIMDLLHSLESNSQDVTGKILMIIILAISYIGTGTLIQSSARKIWDADANGWRKTKKKFDLAHEEIANNDAALQQMIGLLSRYNQNYDSLDRQYDKIHNSILRAEDAVMSEIVGKTIQENPGVNPTDAHAVKDEVLARRGVKREDESAQI